MLNVGDELIFRSADRRGKEHPVKVISVGRKWAILSDRSRADKETGWVDGGRYSSPGRVMTEADLLNENYRKIQWGIIREEVQRNWHPPAWLTNEQLDLVAALLSNLQAQIEERSDTETAEQSGAA